MIDPDSLKKLADMLEVLEVIGTNPTAVYAHGMLKPERFVVAGDNAFAFGPDGYVWFVECDGEYNNIRWQTDAFNLHLHLEYWYNELYKLKAMYDIELFRLLEEYYTIVLNLKSHVRADS